jgi:branched-chain amino acid aminotransferase
MCAARKSWVYHDGAWQSGNVPILGASSHATWLGSLVFDGARFFEGVAPDLDLHCARVCQSARALSLKPTLSPGEIEAIAWEGIGRFEASAALYIRPMYWAEECGHMTVAPVPDSTDFALCLEEVPMAEPRGFTITTTRFRRPTLETMPVNAKAACLYANNARMLQEAKAKGFDNAIVCDANGNVAELATANVFMVRDGAVYTPVANGTFLDGITRRRVAGLLRAAGVAVHEVTLGIEDFRDADEIFSTGNMSKVMPVKAFDACLLPFGPVTQQARRLYWEWAHSR